MKVKITYTVEVNDFQRRAIMWHYGKKQLATRQEVADFFRTFGDGNEVLNDCEIEYEKAALDGKKEGV